MANIVIKDLERNEALDKRAMQNLTGGLSIAPGMWGPWAWPGPWMIPYLPPGVGPIIGALGPFPGWGWDPFVPGPWVPMPAWGPGGGGGGMAA